MGSDPILTEKTLRAHIRNGRIRYFMTSAGGFAGGGFPGGFGGGSFGGGRVGGGTGSNRGPRPEGSTGFVPPRLAAMRSNIVNTWVPANCALVDEATWNKPTDAEKADSNNATTDAARAFPGGPTAGQFTLYDCKGKG